MTYEIHFDEVNRFIVITNHGEFSNQISIEQNIAANELGKQLGIDRFLIDLLDAHYTGTPVEHYKYAYEEVKAEPAINLAARVALLVNADDHSHDFVETVARNNGMNLTLFRDKDQAIRHLTRS